MPVLYLGILRGNFTALETKSVSHVPLTVTTMTQCFVTALQRYSVTSTRYCYPIFSKVMGHYVSL